MEDRKRERGRNVTRIKEEEQHRSTHQTKRKRGREGTKTRIKEGAKRMSTHQTHVSHCLLQSNTSFITVTVTVTEARQRRKSIAYDINY